MLQVSPDEAAAAVANGRMADGCLERHARAFGDGGRVTPVPADARKRLARAVRARVAVVCRGVRGR